MANYNYGIKIDPKDEKYVLKDIPKGFDPDRNKQVIDKVIADNEVKRMRKWKAWEEGTRERANALASYFKHLQRGKSTPVEKYFGRKMAAYLRGQEIIEDLQSAYFTVNRQFQITRYKK